MYTNEIADVEFDNDAEYFRLVDAGLIIPEEEILRMTRPCRYEFEDDIAEFFRWYEHGGSARPRPLDYDELVAFMVQDHGYSIEDSKEKVARESYARRGDKDLWRRMVDREVHRHQPSRFRP